MEHDLRREEGAIVLEIAGELDAMSVSELRPSIDQLVAAAPLPVVIELSGLRLIDSSGVGAIVSIYKRVRAAGGTVTVRGVRDQPLAIFRLLKLDDILIERQAAAI